MTLPSLRLLIVEDSEDDALLLVRELHRGGYVPDFTRVETAQELRSALARGPWDAVFSDYSLPGFTGLDALRIVRESEQDLPFILVSGVMGEETAVEALQAGAHDYLMKGRLARLVSALQRALRDAALRRERRQTAEELTRHREHLEELVQLRTEELAAANEELQAQGEELSASLEELQLVEKDLRAEIAERRRAEQEVQKLNDELKAVNVELEAFNCTVSHDLRGPLTHIRGYCELIMMLRGDQLDEETKGFLREISNGTQRMAKLIDTLLRFSRLAHAELKSDAVDLGELAGKIIGGLKMTEPERAATVTIAPDLHANGDRQLLHQVLENLLGNAWKYTGKQEEARIEFGVTEQGGEKVFFVRDNGEGFDMAHAEQLFLPFARLESAEEFKGHGIGLATVQRIIQRHGGRVWAEGKSGEGATFYFTLP